MATQYANGKIVTSGLVLALDAADRNSYVSGSTVWNDVSGNGNNGTLTNGPTFSSTNGGSIVFDGTNDYVILNGVNSSYFTVSTWINYSSFFNDANGHSIISNNSSTNNGFMLYQATDAPYNRFKIFVVTTSLVQVTSNTLLSTNTWYNIVGSYDGSLIKIYINNTFDNSTAQTGIVTQNPSSLLIGKTSYVDSSFAGRVTQTLIYNRALSASEILQNYNAQKSRFNL